MGEELSRSTGYHKAIDGVAFRAEIRFESVRFWLPDQRRVRVVRTSNLESVGIQPNGHTKLVLRLQKDLIIPTTSREAVQLANALDVLLGEWRAVELRREQAIIHRAKPAADIRP